MPAASNRATNAGGRRTKTAKGRNRDLGALGGPRRATCSVMGIWAVGGRRWREGDTRC